MPYRALPPDGAEAHQVSPFLDFADLLTQGAKRLLIWNPPVVNADLGIRASARSQSTRIARAAVKLGLKTIVFANARRTSAYSRGHCSARAFGSTPRSTYSWNAAGSPP